MDSLYILIPAAMILVALIAIVFLWSVKSGQMDDLEGPAYRVIMDDDDIKTEKTHKEDEESDEKP